MMSKLPKYFILQVWEEINCNIEVENILSYFDGEDQFSMIQNVYNDAFPDEEIPENLRYNRKRRNQTKKRWAQAIIKDYNNQNAKASKDLTQEYQFLKNYKDTYGNVKFQQLFMKKTPEEIIAEKIEKLNEWSNDTHSCLSNYPYILNKATNQIAKAIISDVAIIIGDTLMKNYDGNIQDVVIEKPYSYVNHPIFAEGRGKLDLSVETIQQDMSEYRYNDYVPSSEYRLRTLVAQEYAEDKQVSLLDNTDEKIFIEVLKQRNELFATQRKVVVDIGQVVKNVFNSISIENYNLVKDRLKKMTYVKFNAHTKNKEIIFGLFETFKGDYGPDGWIAEITVNDEIYQEYLNNQTIRMYKDSIKRFGLPLSRSLIFALQKERFSSYSQNRSYEQIYSYNFFASIIRFKSGNKRENMKQLRASLEEMVNHGTGIKSFICEGDKFKIEYIPVTKYEVEDLLHTPSHVNKILGFETSGALINPSAL
ncbi:hypothetical protein P4679_27140 [Priestia megaterium]|uniref:hypothetical protein n=1 Tax=Priestia megaterium TaxID=1404 RepID=UPI002E238CBE|nr:hypothetical protein [Priestia megaterium]